MHSELDNTQCTYLNKPGHKNGPGLVILGIGLGVCVSILCGLAYWLGSAGRASSEVALQPHFVPLAASTADSTDTLAMATGLVSEDAEGVFFLDFITGDLQCMVFYPRNGAFGAHYFANVRAQLGAAGKNSKYLIGTGTIVPRAITAGARPGGCLVYVADVTTGVFAAYAIPWDRTMEASGRAQGGPLVYVGGGQIRNYQLPNPINAAPPAVVDPNANN
jgi:hypothetical protein